MKTLFHFSGEHENQKFFQVKSLPRMNVWKIIKKFSSHTCILIRKHTFFMYVQLLMMINGSNVPCSSDEDYNVAFLCYIDVR